MSEALPLILTRSPTVDDELPSTTRTSSLKLVGGIALVAFALAAVVARTRAATTPNLIADQTLDEPEGFLALVDSPTASPTQCVATYGKCGGGIWTEHVGHSCCDPADTCSCLASGMVRANDNAGCTWNSNGGNSRTGITCCKD